MSNIVIKAESVSKYYRLGVINNGALFKDIQTWWALKLGKHDPHSSIGQNKYDPTKEGFWALSDLNFDIQQGDRIGIIGKNGAGKSTLLKILSRITAPTEGQIKIKGRIASLLEVGTGFHGELTGRENIFLNGAILGMKRREVKYKLDEIIAFSEIEQHIDTPVKRYSSGMYVRLAFAVAAHLDSEILIADEVLAVGDANFQKKALGKMNELSSGQGRTVLFVSHNMGAVKALCNKGIVLEKGKITCDDNIDVAINKYMGLGDSKNKQKTISWYNDGSFYHRNFTPQKLEIIDMNNAAVTDALDYEKEYKIRLIVQVDEPNSFVDFHIVLYKENTIIGVFGMNDFNYNKNINIYEFNIPAKSLLPGEYKLTISSSVKNTEWILNHTESQINANIFVAQSEKPIFLGKKITP